MSDVSWNTRVLNNFIAVVEDQEDATLTAMRDQTLLVAAWTVLLQSGLWAGSTGGVQDGSPAAA